MTLEITLEQLQTQLQIDGVEWLSPEINRYDANIAAEKLLDMVKALRGIDTFYLAAITGLDDGSEKNTMQVLYHFCTGAVVVTARVTLPRTQPVVTSICPIFLYASPFERETGEMFGITFSGTPDTSRLFLSDDWSEGIYPMRKDAVIEVNDDNTK
jgi:Ni,Fe-hydrogenase III component G